LGAEAEAEADEMVEAAIESAEIPSHEAPHEVPEPRETVVEAAPAEVAVEAAPAELLAEPAPAEVMVEAAIESAEIPPVEPEPERELETVDAGNGAHREVDAEPETSSHRQPAVPEGVDIHAVTEMPVSPRRGWWPRLIQ
jgi:hypothetical protein